MVRAEHAACCRPYACNEIWKLRHKVVCVYPTNKIAQNCKYKGITLNEFLSVGMDTDGFVFNFDDSIYDAIFLMRFISLLFRC